MNQGQDKPLWRITCFMFASNALEQNSVEDIWLQVKNIVRRFYHLCHSFKQLKALFKFFTRAQIFNCPKLHEYAVFS